MHDRATLLNDFLSAAGCNPNALTLIAGDASNRSYSRLTMSGRSVVLMDAPPTRGEDVRPFIKIANWLRDQGLSAPEVLAADETEGFLLLEDLGDDLFARLLERDTASEEDLYSAAGDVLRRIAEAGMPRLEPYSAHRMSELSALAVTWYRSGLTGTKSPDLEAELQSVMAERLAPLDEGPHVLIQRDYHAENLLWLPRQTGVARVGLLDFQDAEAGHPAYDLVSVLQDARRDVSPDIQERLLQDFMTDSADPIAFKSAYHLLGVQRNLRILGVFARLCVRDGKPGYIDLIPRVWGHIMTNLDALDSKHLRDLVTDILPEPNETVLARLKARKA